MIVRTGVERDIRTKLAYFNWFNWLQLIILLLFTDSSIWFKSFQSIWMNRLSVFGQSLCVRYRHARYNVCDEWIYFVVTSAGCLGVAITIIILLREIDWDESTRFAFHMRAFIIGNSLSHTYVCVFYLFNLMHRPSRTHSHMHAFRQCVLMRTKLDR